MTDPTHDFGEVAREIVNEAREKLKGMVAGETTFNNFWEPKIAKALTLAVQANDRKWEKSFKKSELHDFYQWEIDRHAIEYEVEFRGNEIASLKSQLQEKEKELEDYKAIGNLHELSELRSQLQTLKSKLPEVLEALILAEEWGAKYPLKGEPSTADMNASDTVRFACSNALTTLQTLMKEPADE